MEKSNTKWVAALLVGTAVVGTLGMLWSSREGKRMKRRMANCGDDVVDSLERKYQAFVDEVDHVRARANHLAKSGISRMERIKIN